MSMQPLTTQAPFQEGESEGPRERLLRNGPASLSDAELVGILFGTGAKGESARQLAQRVLFSSGGLRALCQQDPQELCAQKGLGPARAAQVLAALELGRRMTRAEEERPRIRSVKDALRHLEVLWGSARREEFCVLYLSSRGVLVHRSRVAEGTVDACAVDVREVFGPAVTARASAVVLAHNHPSGDPEPSAQDFVVTRRLVQAGGLLSIRVLDHLVVAGSRHVSMREKYPDVLGGDDFSGSGGGGAWFASCASLP